MTKTRKYKKKRVLKKSRKTKTRRKYNKKGGTAPGARWSSFERFDFPRWKRPKVPNHPNVFMTGTREEFNKNNKNNKTLKSGRNGVVSKFLNRLGRRKKTQQDEVDDYGRVRRHDGIYVPVF
uniref:Uncharacterized protein n=1 Tax=viral metagenome TaxID=1070528 RepID=A0A6C0KLK1_9ZZZZ